MLYSNVRFWWPAAPIDCCYPSADFVPVVLGEQLDETDDAGGDVGAIFGRERVNRLEHTLHIRRRDIGVQNTLNDP